MTLTIKSTSGGLDFMFSRILTTIINITRIIAANMAVDNQPTFVTLIRLDNSDNSNNTNITNNMAATYVIPVFKTFIAAGELFVNVIIVNVAPSINITQMEKTVYFVIISKGLM